MDDSLLNRRLRALELRYVLTSYLRELGPLSVKDLTGLLERDGFAVWGRQSKTISDALRWEIGRGRVIRTGRGRYASGRIPRGTAHRIRRRVELIRAREFTPPFPEVMGPVKPDRELVATRRALPPRP